MTNTNVLPTKTQITALIATCLDAGYNEAAGLLTLASESISENVKRDTSDKVSAKLDEMIADMDDAIANVREANAINDRMVEGAAEILLKMQDNPDHPLSTDEIKAEYVADAKDWNDQVAELRGGF